MSPYVVTLRKPGREDKFYEVAYLAPRLELAVNRLHCSHDVYKDWYELRMYDTGIFLETYLIEYVDCAQQQATAIFRSIRRSHELARTFNPARLPA